MAKKLSYKSAGVNIDAAVDALSKAKRTSNPIQQKW